MDTYLFISQIISTTHKNKLFARTLLALYEFKNVEAVV